MESPKALDVNFVNPFLVATATVLKIQSQTVCKAGTPFKREPGESLMGDISGVIDLASDNFSGYVIISFPAETFLKIMSRMLGENYTEMTKEIEDGASEITNIVFGQAKVALNEKGFGIRTAIPSVISGESLALQNPITGPRVAIPFDTDVGPFVVEVCSCS